VAARAPRASAKPANGVFAALLRGINVGTAKRVPMEDLRALAGKLGHTGARTLLNSGNLVFRARAGTPAALAGSLEAAIAKRFGFEVATIVLSAAELREVVKEHAKAAAGREEKRLLVAFVQSPALLAAARPLLSERWAPDELRIGKRAALLWCATGINSSKLVQAFEGATRRATTTRNWATVRKLLELAGGLEGAGA